MNSLKIQFWIRLKFNFVLKTLKSFQNLHKEFNESTNFLSSCCLPSHQPTKPSTTTESSQPQKSLKQSSTTVAIKCLSFSVESGEVLGILGHTGAGKTTTLRIITGEIQPTRGQVKIAGQNVINSQSNALKMLGYCPQNDALWKNVTVKEHLEVYAAIRGIHGKDRRRLINTYLHGLHITEHANKQTRHLSGGTKRKLSYAIAMLGAPKVVLLDEPSTGMDPKSKRFLWDTILGKFWIYLIKKHLNLFDDFSASFQGSRGAILTTHAMEEADALCSKVGIMAKGELR